MTAVQMPLGEAVNLLANYVVNLPVGAVVVPFMVRGGVREARQERERPTALRFGANTDRLPMACARSLHD